MQLIRKLSKPKLVNGAEISGPELADLIERMVAALNSRDIPTAGSILEHFNKDLIHKVFHEAFNARIGRLSIWSVARQQAADWFGLPCSSQSSTQQSWRGRCCRWN